MFEQILIAITSEWYWAVLAIIVLFASFIYLGELLFPTITWEKLDPVTCKDDPTKMCSTEISVSSIGQIRMKSNTMIKCCQIKKQLAACNKLQKRLNK